jgi:hypothetical protein
MIGSKQRKRKGGKTHKYVLANGRKLDRRGGVRLLYVLVQRELIARLNLARGEKSCDVCMGSLGGACGDVGDDRSHFRIFPFSITSILGLARFGELISDVGKRRIRLLQRYKQDGYPQASWREKKWLG